MEKINIEDIFKKFNTCENTFFYHRLAERFVTDLVAFWVVEYEKNLGLNSHKFYDIILVKDYINAVIICDQFNYSIQSMSLLRVAYEYLFRVLSEILKLAAYKKEKFLFYETTKKWQESFPIYFDESYYIFYKKLSNPIHKPISSIVDSDLYKTPFPDEYDKKLFIEFLDEYVHKSSDLILISAKHLGFDINQRIIPRKEIFSENFIKKLTDINFNQGSVL